MNESSVLGQLESLVQQIEAPIGSAVQNVLSYVENGFQNYVLSPISNDVTGALDTLGNSVSYLGNVAGQALTTSLNAVSNTLGTVEQTVVSGVENGLNVVSNSISNIAQVTEQDFESTVQSITAGFDAITQQVGQGFSVIVNGLEQGFQELGNFIVTGVEEVVTPIATFLEGLPQDIATIASQVKSAVEDIVTGIGSLASQALTIATKDFDIAASAVEKASDPATWIGAKQLFGDTIFNIISGITGLDLSKADPLALGRLGVAFDVLFSVGVSLDMLSGFEYILGTNAPQLLEVALAGSWRDLEQMANGAVPNVLLRIGELVESRYRTLIDEAFYYDQMERHGISDSNADVLYAAGAYLLGMNEVTALYRRGLLKGDDDFTARAAMARVDAATAQLINSLYDQLLPVTESVTLWRRGILPSGFTDYFDDLVAAGWTQERIDAIKSASYHLLTPPQYAEAIFRGVFDDSVVSQYGYDDGITDDYIANAAANGFDADTARYLYRLSRPVAPFFITENLFKSGKLSESAFREQLALAGYSTYWQDQFVQNLTPTLTQADIKDLYKYKAISIDDVPAKLQSIGVPADLAQEYAVLWEATVKQASPLETTNGDMAAASVQGETKALILDAYKDGVLTNAEALSHLEEINITDDAAVLMLQIADYEQSQAAIKLAYEDAAADLKIGATDLTSAINQVQQAGATAIQLDRYTAMLTKVGTAKGTMPTKAEFVKWYGDQIITVEQLAEAYSLLGYSDGWIYYYLLADGVSQAEVEELLPGVTLPI